MKALYEKIIPLESSSFKAFSYEMDEFDNPWHYHPEYELTYILSSEGIRYTGNSFENFKENDFVMLGPNLPHCWKNTGTQTQKASAIVIHWDAHFLGKEWIETREFEPMRKLLQLSEKGLKFDPGIALELKHKLEHLLTLSSFEKLIALLEILNQLSSTSKFTTLCERNFHDELNVVDHERINIIYQYIKTKYTEKITLAEVASQVHMRGESFSRFFTKIMNKPFFSFLNEYRVNAACKMLIESDVQVAQISYACGFESMPFFYRQFKKYKATSPQQYRKAYWKISFSSKENFFIPSYS